MVPSVLSVAGAVQKSIPDRLSVPVKLTTTLVLFQPFALGPGDALALAVGGVLSMLMPVWVFEAELPALSVQVAVADCPAPSLVNDWVTTDETAPEPVSVQFHVRATLVLFQPAEFGAGFCPTNVMAGGVVSNVHVNDAPTGSVLPTASVARTLKEWVPSPVTV